MLFVIKGRWQGSAPISCTLPHTKALAHWRQVRRNYLFQGGYPRYHLIYTPPRSGSPSWFPQSPGDCGIWASPLEAGQELLFQGGYPRYHPICTPLGGPPSWVPTPQSSFPATQILPTASVYFLNVVSLVEAQTKPRKRIINANFYEAYISPSHYAIRCIIHLPVEDDNNIL